MKSQLHIIAGYKNHKTYLKYNYCGQPFKLANITEDKSGSVLRLMIMSSSPGVLDHDNYSIEVCIEEDAKMYLTTQGYQRLFTMTNHASQCMNVHVHNNGSFCFLPHPNVPHEASNFSSVNNIFLSENHNLLWSEIITCGRKLSGEEFKFTRFHNVTNVYLNNKLVVKENVLLEPLKKNVHAIGQLEGYSHQSTLLFIHDHADMKKILDQCKELLSGVEDITFGISALPVNGLIFRILGYKGEKLFKCNNELASLIQNLLHDNTHIETEIILPATHLKT
ncbi:MAG: urease accessory protein UreD [Ginsengibacter sp.]